MHQLFAVTARCFAARENKNKRSVGEPPGSSSAASSVKDVVWVSTSQGDTFHVGCGKLNQLAGVTEITQSCNREKLPCLSHLQTLNNAHDAAEG